MSLRFLVDTNIISEPLRPRPNLNTIQMLDLHKGEIAIATIVWHELLFGCNRLPESKKRQQISKYLQEVIEPNIPILPYDIKAATWHAGERARLVTIGKTPSYTDGQIAAVAKTNNLIVVTNNVSDYSDFFDLRIENWYR